MLIENLNESFIEQENNHSNPPESTIVTPYPFINAKELLEQADQHQKTIAALVQLLVPVIALIMSILFLNEKLSYVSFLSSLLIIFGVTVGICAEKLIKKWL